MAAWLKVTDERFGPRGVDRRPSAELRLVSERVTAREIIRRRVEAELEAIAARPSRPEAHRSFLVDMAPDSPERRLNPPARRRPARALRPEAEIAAALDAFARRRFLLLLDGRQVDDLDAEVTLAPDSQAVFLYLTPLKGG